MNGTSSDRLLVAGIDVGTSAVKVVFVEDRAGAGATVILKQRERIRRRDPQQVVSLLFDACLAEAGLEREAFDYVATTGEGEVAPFRTGHFYGMTTHARGALFLDPDVRAVLDVGALHARAILLDHRAKVLGNRMTSQCASGSGQFLENISRYLGITLEEIGPLSLEADKPEVSSSICAVLAETDVINMVSRGISTPNIVKGIHQSMANRYLKLVSSLGARGILLVTGGLAADVGLLTALREGAAESGLDVEIRTHEDSVLAGAVGAALWGAFRARKLAASGVAL